MNHIGRTIVINLTPTLMARLRLSCLIVLLIAVTSFVLNYKAFVSPPTNLCETPMHLSLNNKLDKDYEETKKIARNISNRYGTDPGLAEQIVLIAKGYAYKDFPSLSDVLSIIGIESSFDPKISFQGAHGLMQIEFSSHLSEVAKKDDLFDVPTNIFLGVKTLRQYYEMLKDKDAAVLAYNIGIGTYLEGKYSAPYLDKFKNERKYYGS